ncbi:FAD-dependent oxidoreductase [Glutamicibacter sp. MNS18]|uniref:FAD-dependent oxidoreductase n=1 Tax=Glutamicibacter sp. MNS18 TaxID=2989817 RepID=UPI0022362EFC|nr:FAD-dependent oxidoreductase [Glutamicibacter sp. MNS18]MCW4466795.1 FAD-dependent oxidoreductase [Glutamicibacter sp. MNS18]
MFGIHANVRTVIADNIADLVSGLRLLEESRAAQRTFFTRLAEGYRANTLHGRLRLGHRDGMVQFVCHGNISGYLERATDPGSGLLEQWVGELLEVAPRLRGRILGSGIQSWGHCFSLLTPTSYAALASLQPPIGDGLHFAGDYSSGTAGTHGAYTEAQRVTRDILRT